MTRSSYYAESQSFPQVMKTGPSMGQTASCEAVQEQPTGGCIPKPCNQTNQQYPKLKSLPGSQNNQ